MHLRFLSIIPALGLAVSHAAAEDSADIAALAWLAGDWIGEGRAGDDGAVEGVARQYWTPPREDSVSYTFAWHKEDTDHVHYAFTAFEQTENGVVGKGIHYGRDFKTFEENPWSLEAREIKEGVAVFECVAHCRGKAVAFRMLDNGVMEERWTPLSRDDPDWIVHYRRAE